MKKVRRKIRTKRDAAWRAAPTFALLGLAGVFAPAAWPQAPAPAPVPATPEDLPATRPVSETLPEVRPVEVSAAPDGSDVLTPQTPPPGGDPRQYNFRRNGQNSGGASSAERLLGPIARDLTITGGMTLAHQSSEISGGRNGVAQWRQETINPFGSRSLGPFQQNWDLTIQGKLFDVFTVNGRLSNQRYGNYFNQQFGINYDRNGTKFNLGNITASLTGNELVTFQRSLDGIYLSRDLGGFGGLDRVRVSGVASLTRAVPRRGSFQGQGSSGPYYLNAAQIIEGTERLRLNGLDLERGKDYEIDAFTGQVRFSRIIGPEETVEYSFETQNYNATPGLLVGSRLDFDVGGGSRFGVTYLTQKATTGHAGVNELVERFPVVADPTYKYTLSALIQPQTEVVVEYLEQRLLENVDYILNRDLHYVLLRRPFPPDTSYTGFPSLRIQYKPVRQSSVGGDRTVMGLDGNLQLGPNANLGVQFGQSQGRDGKGVGSAMKVSANVSGEGTGGRHRWSLNTVWNDIDAGFSTIDSVSGAFLSARKGLNANLSYQPSEFVTFTSAFDQGRVAQQYYYGLGTGGTGTTTGTNGATPVNWASTGTYQAGVSLRFPRLPTLDFRHSQVTQNSQGSGSNRSQFTSTSLDLGWQKGILGVSTTLARTSGRGRSVWSSYANPLNQFGANQATIIDSINNSALLGFNNSTSDNANIRVSLTPISWVGLSASLGMAKTRYGSGAGATGGDGTASASTNSTNTLSATSARDMSASVTLTPGSNFSLQASLSDATNGQSTGSFYSGGGSLSGGIGSGGSFLPGARAGQRTRSQNLSLQYRPFAPLSLNFSTSHALSLIPDYDNTDSQTSQLSANWEISRTFQIAAQLLNQKVAFTGNQGDVNTRSLNLTGFASFGRLNLTTSWQRSNSGSALFYGSGAGGGSGLPGLPGGGSSGGFGNTYGGGGGYGSGYGTGGYGTDYGIGGYGGGYGTGQSFLSQDHLTLLSFNAEYGLGGGRSLALIWTTMDRSNPLGADQSYGGETYHTSSNSVRSQGTLRFYLPLNSLLGVNLDANLIHLKDRENTSYSYRARTLNMNLGLQF